MQDQKLQNQSPGAIDRADQAIDGLFTATRNAVTGREDDNALTFGPALKEFAVAEVALYFEPVAASVSFIRRAVTTTK